MVHCGRSINQRGGFPSPPLAPLLGELSSASETEGSPWLRDCQWGKELSALRPVFSLLHRNPPRRPLSPVCALGTSHRRGSASRHCLNRRNPPHPPTKKRTQSVLQVKNIKLNRRRKCRCRARPLSADDPPARTLCGLQPPQAGWSRYCRPELRPCGRTAC